MRMESGALGCSFWLWATSVGYSCGARVGESPDTDPEARPRKRRWSEAIAKTTTGASDLEAPRRAT